MRSIVFTCVVASVVMTLSKIISSTIPRLTLTDLFLSHAKLFQHMTLISA